MTLVLRLFSATVGKLGKNHPLIVKFRLHEDKEPVVSSRMIKSTNIYLNDDLCQESKRRRDSLIPIVKEIKKVDSKAHMKEDKLWCKGKLYSAENIYFSSLPLGHLPNYICIYRWLSWRSFSGHRLTHMLKCPLS